MDLTETPFFFFSFALHCSTVGKNGVAEALNFRRSARRAKLESLRAGAGDRRVDDPEFDVGTIDSVPRRPDARCARSLTPMTGDRKQV